MKKSIFLISMALLTGTLFFSCASIPEPNEKNTNLVYGQVEFSFTNQTNANLLPESDRMKNGVSVVLLNRKTNKKYTFTTNSRGEFTRVNIPEGPYRLDSVKKAISANGHDIIFGGDMKQSSKQYDFYIYENYVNNIGKLKLDITMENVSRYYLQLHWAYGFKDCMEDFWKDHSDSNWVYKEWRNVN